MAHREHRSVTAADVAPPARGLWGNLPAIGLGLGALGLAGSLLLSRGRIEQFYFSWLTAFVFCLSIALGGLFVVLAHFASQAGWSVAIRRVAEHAMSTLPVFALLFVPVVLGLGHLFHWTDGGVIESSPALRAKAPYLSVGFFLARAAGYFVAWTVMALWFRRRSRAQDSSGDHDLTRSMQRVSAPSLVVFAVTVTFAAIDWIMLLDPHWYSTIFGVYYFSGCVVAIYAFLAVAFFGLRAAGALRGVVSGSHFHDMGKMLWAFTIFWTYIAFSQYFLIWYGNIPEETVWYLHRLEGSWLSVTRALAVGHFVVPFFLLMSHKIKRQPALLAIGGVWMLAMHYLDMYWLVMPTLHEHGVVPSGVDLTALLAVGGFALAAFGWSLRTAPLLPVRDPRLAESLSLESA